MTYPCGPVIIGTGMGPLLHILAFFHVFSFCSSFKFLFSGLKLGSISLKICYEINKSSGPDLF